MSKVLLKILFLSFISLTLFGFAAMAHEADHSHSSQHACLASSVSSIPCDKTKTHDDQGLLHFTIFKSFSLAIQQVLISTVAFASLLLLSLLFYYYFLFFHGSILDWHTLKRRWRHLKFRSLHFFRQFIFWISLHEKRDPQAI